MTLPYLTPLGPDQIAAAGVPGRWVFGHRDKVRFAEIDRLNHVNNLAYLQWFEVLRVQYFVAWGMTRYEPDDPQLVVRAQSADYHTPMHLGDSYLLACRTSRVGRTSFTIDYVCFSQSVRASGQSVIVMLDADTGRPKPLPNDIVSRFREIDGATFG